MKRDVLRSDEQYAFLDEAAAARLNEIRQACRNSGLAAVGSVVPITPTLYAVFPFIGTRATAALVFALRERGFDAQVYLSRYIPVCIEVRTVMGIEELCAALDEIKLCGADKYSFSIPDNCEISGKYNDYIPRELLKKQYVEDYLDTEDMRLNMEGEERFMLNK